MRTLGYLLLIVGFLWAAYVPVSTDPLLRAMDTAYRQSHSNLAGQQTYSAKDMLSAFTGGAEEFARLARFGGIGTLLMLAGGIVLDRAGKRPPLLPKP